MIQFIGTMFQCFYVRYIHTIASTSLKLYTVLGYKRRSFPRSEVPFSLFGVFIVNLLIPTSPPPRALARAR